jgi:hypothetical protein
MKTKLMNATSRRGAVAVAGAVTVTLVAVASGAAKPVDVTGADARAMHIEPPPVHAKRKVVRDVTPRFDFGSIFPTARVNTSGLASLTGTLALVDDSGHIVNAKGNRVGGLTP